MKEPVILEIPKVLFSLSYLIMYQCMHLQHSHQHAGQTKYKSQGVAGRVCFAGMGCVQC